MVTGERPARVLIVDDVEDFRTLVRVLLEPDPLLEVVAEAEDGQQAVRLASDHQPDVILLDLSMPIMDGLEALPLLREHCPESKILIVSGFEMSPSVHAQALGADGYFQKGNPLSALVSKISGLLAEQPA
jgi:DNA-binding NarL/FixJ family response regulator